MNDRAEAIHENDRGLQQIEGFINIMCRDCFMFEDCRNPDSAFNVREQNDEFFAKGLVREALLQD